MLQVSRTVHRDSTRDQLLAGLGRAVRQRRSERDLTIVALSVRAGVSQRFLAQLEAGLGNISVARLCDVAAALGTTASELLRAAEPGRAQRSVVALVGLRGAGKSTIGSKLARKLGVAFVELDHLVEGAAGLSLGEVFALHGEAYYRRLEREALRRVLADEAPAVLATGGSIVSDPECFALLRSHTTTIWLKARPEEHMQRVRAQGDDRPTQGRDDAMAELRALLRARAPLYAQADHVVDTTALGTAGSVDAALRLVSA